MSQLPSVHNPPLLDDWSRIVGTTTYASWNNLPPIKGNTSRPSVHRRVVFIKAKTRENFPHLHDTCNSRRTAAAAVTDSSLSLPPSPPPGHGLFCPNNIDTN